MTQSGTVAFGTEFTAERYNDLRADILSATIGHRHTGADGDGKVLTAAAFQVNSIPALKIADRTRRFFVQALAGMEGGTTPIYVREWCRPGITLRNGVVAYAEGRFVLPVDAASSTITVRPVMIAGYLWHRPSTLRAVYINTTVVSGTYGTAIAASSTSSGYTRFYPHWWYFTLDFGPSLNVTLGSYSDPIIVGIKTERDGTSGQDTSTYNCLILGWMVEYTATA